MKRVDGIDINIYWSDLTKEAKENIIYHLMVAGIELSPMIRDDQKPFAWTAVDKDGD